MQTIHVNYSITVSDFRKATYYGLFLRHRRALQIMFLVLGVSILYAIGGALGLGTVNYLVFFLALAYLIWGIFLFAGAEKGIRQYLASPHNTLGCDYDVTIDAHHIRVCIPSRKGDSSFFITKLACVYELSSMYLLYVNTQEVYLLPKARSYSRAGQRAARAAARNDRRTVWHPLCKALKAANLISRSRETQVSRLLFDCFFVSYFTSA